MSDTPLRHGKARRRRWKQWTMVAADAVALPIALWSATTLRFTDPRVGLQVSPWIYALAALAGVLCFARLGLYRAVIRFMGIEAIGAVVAGVTLSTLALLLATIVLAEGALGLTDERLSISVLTIYWAFALIYVGSTRLAWRAWHYSRDVRGKGRERTLIYGAGRSGLQTMMALRRSPSYVPVAIVDDDPAVRGSTFDGLKVRPSTELQHLLRVERPSQILVAVQAQGARRRALDQLQALGLEDRGIRVRIMPSIEDVVAGRSNPEALRAVEPEDLLGRDPVEADPALLAATVAGRVVLVTGAGGSIGSELCRQIAQAGPARLLLFEHSEFALFQVHRELAARHPDLALTPVLGSILDRDRLAAELAQAGVRTLFHAAAYKHVPMAEANVRATVLNNAIGTLRVLEAAEQAGCERVVLISTDKAVHPSSVMGATKRLAELTLQAWPQRDPARAPMRLTIVRFGNVLGSSGSVIPLFKEQIAGGGPVRVTHPDVTRYFMTVSEAVQLVLQSAGMTEADEARGGLYLLDMGEPVRIVDLARSMIRLAGLRPRDDAHPDGEIEIVFTGLRPGEKLTEELSSTGDALPTRHPRIFRVREPMLPWTAVRDRLAVLDGLCRAGTEEAVLAALWRALDTAEPPAHGA
ncbi:polysaccharide biosynthesis protein [Zavarzinia sp. CC-PAN008]|uniref:polysaccharide biosynthesis protein n=1 Tax=Zavarzinia sp. CC-PAN008 TaxID=3243332 RepID=UPI003F745009